MGVFVEGDDVMAKKKDFERDNRLKTVLQQTDQRTLAKLILDFCALNADNRTFVETRLAVAPDSLASYKKRIEEALYPEVYGRRSVSIAAARKAVTEYKRATNNQNGLLELMLHYVECGTAFTADYGDMWEEYYSSLQSMYDRLLKGLDKADDHIKESFRNKLRAVVDRAQGVGWGYHDYLVEGFVATYPDEED